MRKQDTRKSNSWERKENEAAHYARWRKNWAEPNESFWKQTKASTTLERDSETENRCEITINAKTNRSISPWSRSFSSFSISKQQLKKIFANLLEAESIQTMRIFIQFFFFFLPYTTKIKAYVKDSKKDQNLTSGSLFGFLWTPFRSTSLPLLSYPLCLSMPAKATKHLRENIRIWEPKTSTFVRGERLLNEVEQNGDRESSTVYSLCAKQPWFASEKNKMLSKTSKKKKKMIRWRLKTKTIIEIKTKTY